MFRALAKRVGGRWKFVSFRGPGGAEWRGVVDILAVRKSTAAPTVAGLKAGDLFDFVLVQLKGGSAPMPTKEDVARLRKVAKHYRAVGVVLYTWKRGTHSQFLTLQPNGSWSESSAKEAFA